MALGNHLPPSQLTIASRTKLQLEGGQGPASRTLLFLSSGKSFLMLDPVSSIKGTQLHLPLPGTMGSLFFPFFFFKSAAVTYSAVTVLYQIPKCHHETAADADTGPFSSSTESIGGRENKLRHGGQAWLWGQMFRSVLNKRIDPSPVVRTMRICRLTSAYNFTGP